MEKKIWKDIKRFKKKTMFFRLKQPTTEMFIYFHFYDHPIGQICNDFNI